MFISFALILLFLTGAASAADDANVTADNDVIMPAADDAQLDEVDSTNSTDEAQDYKNASFSVDDGENYIKKTYFEVTLLDENATPMADRDICFTIKNSTFSNRTDENGTARLNLTVSKGYHLISYRFNDTGYNEIEGSKRIFVITTPVSTLTCKHAQAYANLKNVYEFKLKVGKLALANRTIIFKINGKKFKRTTDASGKVKLRFKLPLGKYKLKYYYLGEKNINASSGKEKIKVIRIPTSIKRANNIVYKDGISAPFKVKLTDKNGKALSGQKISFTLNKRTYTVKTNSKGVASLSVNLAEGSYSLKASFKNTDTYAKSSYSQTLYVKSAGCVDNGFWLFGADMNSVDLNTLEKYGTKHIFLNFKAIELYGKKGVEKFVKNAKSHGIKVHIWTQAFYLGGKWYNPVKNGKIDYDLINSKVKEIKSYAKIKGIAGVHIDYIRYPGTAYKYPNAVNAINLFTKKVCSAVHGVKSGLIVSAAIMPEPASLKYYYGQDIPTMSKYLDALVPMIYKGNYRQGTAWIKSMTQTFVSMSKGAEVWTGLQTYNSDSDVSKLSSKALMKDADAAASGGAGGVILFRLGLVNYINFNNVG